MVYLIRLFDELRERRIFMDITINCSNIENGQTCIIPASDPFFTPFFSSGDIMISMLLFLLLVIEIIKLLRAGIKSVEVTRKFQGNNSPDGKEFYKL